MDAGFALGVALVAYLIGAVSFARLVSRLVAPSASITDVTLPVPGTEDRFKVTGIGANTAGTVLGRRVGCAIGILDMLKAIVPTAVLRVLYPDQPYYLIAATLVMVGHNWPIFHRFQGGRGFSVSYGGMLVVDPLGAVLSSLAG